MGSCAPCAYSLREETGGFPSRMGSLSLPSLFYNISDIQFCDLLDVWFPKGQALVSLGLWHQAQQHLRCSGMLAAGVLRTPLSKTPGPVTGFLFGSRLFSLLSIMKKSVAMISEVPFRNQGVPHSPYACCPLLAGSAQDLRVLEMPGTNRDESTAL